MACAAIAPVGVQAQERTFINGGFEANDPQGPGAPSWQLFPNADVPNWTDDTGLIELWDSGFLGTPAHEGNVLAEMNAANPGTLYQNICLLAGETLSWSFAHRARPGGPNPQIAILEIADTNGVFQQSLATQTSAIGSGWNVNTGSAPYTGTTGVRRVRFTTTNPGSVGNLIDDLQLSIPAFAQFGAASSSDAEASGGNIPAVILHGRVDNPVAIPFSVAGGTADTTDYTSSATHITIPAGVYSGEAFPLPVSITDNTISEDNETIVFTLGTPASPDILIVDRFCTGTPPISEATYTILNDDAELSGTKTVEAFPAGSYNTPGNDVIYTLTITNKGDIPASDLFLLDTLPPDVVFYNADHDGPGPGSNPVGLTQTGTGLTLSYAGNVGFSESPTPPTGMGDCTDSPTGLLDAGIRHVCIAPGGSLAAGPPETALTVRFRTRIK